jgi:hypothetical protein
MIFDGVIVKIFQNNMDSYFLFILDPKSKTMMEGIPIPKDSKFDDLDEYVVMIVKAEFMDGTNPIEDFDLDGLMAEEPQSSNILIRIKDFRDMAIGYPEGDIYTVQDLLDSDMLSEYMKACIDIIKSRT